MILKIPLYYKAYERYFQVKIKIKKWIYRLIICYNFFVFATLWRRGILTKASALAVQTVSSPGAPDQKPRIWFKNAEKSQKNSIISLSRGFKTKGRSIKKGLKKCQHTNNITKNLYL